MRRWKPRRGTLRLCSAETRKRPDSTKVVDLGSRGVWFAAEGSGSENN
jgi:hypothetical protein